MPPAPSPRASSEDAPSVASTPVSRPATPAVEQPEAPADFDFGMSSIWDETGTVGEEAPSSATASAPKKRRRRRPRKSAGQKVEVGREQNQDAPFESAPAQPRPAASRPTAPRPVASEPVESRPTESTPRPEPSPVREPRPARKTAPEPQAPPAKPRKKIFLE